MRIPLLLFAAFLAAPAVASPPNVLLIFVDDQGTYDLGCYGEKQLQTPRIDSLARDGIRFTAAYSAAPICSPSRAGLLTGCYPRRMGAEIWVHRADSKSGLHPDELTLAELFRGAGYRTACIGKWHLGFAPPFLPDAQGFDRYFGLLHNLDPVETVHFADKGGVPILNGSEIIEHNPDPSTLTRRYTDEAIHFIEEDRNKPFFLYLPHTMLHNPLGVSEEFRGTSKLGEYGDAIHELDHHVGRLLDALERLDIADETIVLYTSDNGRHPGRGKDQPLRGGKLSTWEGGLRVPALLRGPGLRSGAVRTEPTPAMDWYPTLATLTGIRVPEGRVIDGRDLAPELVEEPAALRTAAGALSLNSDLPQRRRWEPPLEWRDLVSRDEYTDAFFYHGSHGALAAVRSGKWKLFLNPTLQLYDLESDPGETSPVKNAAVARKLRGMAVLFQEEMRLDARPAGRTE
ncbi:N-acetylgalactosamine-6-sulfatase [Haloferula helveola]|uniref:N-acetylgalactosamine-6-sulfatase n=1 Tax=Haloferula helveola TaxID=490095 RepID=A0ABM7R9U3_9BACT|nr:N-acetylgalactosamine-6-sulfatase [Haloferula helveola]